MKDKDYIKHLETEINGLEKTIERYTEIFFNLGEEINQLKTANENLRVDGDKLHAENKKLKQENKRLKYEIQIGKYPKVNPALKILESLKEIELNDLKEEYNKLKEKQRKAGLRIKGLKEELKREKRGYNIAGGGLDLFSFSSYSIPNNEKETMLHYARDLKKYCKNRGCKGCVFNTSKDINFTWCSIEDCPEDWEV
ncbi:MAG: hypothetical protein GY714_20825 [Desulfobacterales bacterium]|nr:hypothetical protein [Desulfobacterales bacterium]